MEENKNVTEATPAAPAAADYKDVTRLRKFITESGKMLPRRMSGTCAKHQRELSKAIKRARVAALLPFKAD